jgi:hypothetical protein
MLNVAYAMLVVVVFQSWLLTWHLDRTFPFNMIPMWAFCLISTVAGFLSLRYYRRAPNQPKFGYDKFNIYLIYATMGSIIWIVVAVMLIHTYYIGDFNIGNVILAIISGKAPLPFVELPLQSVDVFPTLGDSIFIAYLLSFVFLYLASWRGIKARAHDCLPQSSRNQPA